MTWNSPKEGASLCGTDGKESAFSAGDPGLILVRKIPRRRGNFLTKINPL